MATPAISSETEPDTYKMADLSPGEALLILTMRRWALAISGQGSHHLEINATEYRAAFPHTHSEVLVSVRDLLRTIAMGTRRTIHHHMPGCPYVSADEIAFVTLVAAAQANETGLIHKLARLLLDEHTTANVHAASDHAGRILRQSGCQLPLRLRNRRVPANIFVASEPAARASVH